MGLSSLRGTPASAVPHGPLTLVLQYQLWVFWVPGVGAGQCYLLLKLLGIETQQTWVYISALSLTEAKSGKILTPKPRICHL